MVEVHSFNSSLTKNILTVEWNTHHYKNCIYFMRQNARVSSNTLATTLIIFIFNFNILWNKWYELIKWFCVPSFHGLIDFITLLVFDRRRRLSFGVFQSVYLRLYTHALNTNNNNPLKTMLHLPDRCRCRWFQQNSYWPWWILSSQVFIKFFGLQDHGHVFFGRRRSLRIVQHEQLIVCYIDLIVKTFLCPVDSEKSLGRATCDHQCNICDYRWKK